MNDLSPAPKMKRRSRYLTVAIVFVWALFTQLSSVHAMERMSRLGIGYTGQLKNDVPAISFKIQKSKSMAFGGMLGYSNKENGGGVGAAAKIYRILFDEPNLTFYGSLMAGLITQKNNGENNSGFQADITLGSEFSFTGLQSLGFSLEFGASFHKLDNFVSETVGDSFLVSAVHFYL